MKYLFFIFFLFLVSLPCQLRAQNHIVKERDAEGVYYSSVEEQKWVDSVYNTLTMRQRIAQLMVIRVPSNMKDDDENKFLRKIEQTRVGGICFFAGKAEQQLRLTKLCQQHSFVPLMICIDGEWGLGMRLKDCFSFPRQSIYGTLPSVADTIVYDVGREIGRQCRMMGVHVNFAPVMDVNSNPKNPVIGTRSFSDSPQRVAALGIQYMLGLQSQGVMAVAKHFPGHGDTETDSHKTLPIVPHPRQHLDSIELLPFRSIIEKGVQGMMTAHLFVPSLDSTVGLPSSLSYPIVTGLLRKEMGFDGLIFTDGMEMKGVTKGFGTTEAALRALRAGNDVILLPADLEGVLKTIHEAATYDSDLKKRIEVSCRRVLRAKYRLKLDQINLNALHVPTSNDSLRCEMVMEGVTLNNDQRIDNILLNGIREKAYPGCQMLVMRHGMVIYRRAYGYYTYDDANSCKVNYNTLYDLASVTKVAATTLAIMKLVDDGEIALDDSLSQYLPYLKNSNKQSITIREALSHNARLKAFDQYWALATTGSEIRNLIAQSALQREYKYLYSDLGPIMLADVVESVSGMPLDQYMHVHFYAPMNLKHISFKPLEQGFDYDQIAPTEEEMVYRNRLIHGIVHDPNAYALGGVAGHAGLFSNADDLGALMQMLLNGGTYGGKRLLSSAVIDTFNNRYFTRYGNRRALGFDKPLINGDSPHVAAEVSQSSFGHTGFTGTMVWVDPKYDLIYIFLSNRVYPSATPNKLAQMNIRTDIQKLIYQDLKLNN